MKEIRKKVLTYLFVALLALVCALNYQLFVFPNRFAPAGLNGICTMIQHLSGISLGYLSLLINIPLAIVAWRTIGSALAGRSMTYVVVFSLALIVLGRADLSSFVYETSTGTSTILGPLVAGVINGACYSMLVRCSASSGGTDFIAALIHKNHPEQGFFWITFSINACIAVASYFVYGFQIEPVILCILYCFMTSMVSDRLMKNGRSAIRCEIITPYPKEISCEIIEKLRHTATRLSAQGMYKGEETHVLLCIVNPVQLSALTEIVRKYPHTFVSFSGVSEVVGNFKKLDKKGRQRKNMLDTGNAEFK